MAIGHIKTEFCKAGGRKAGGHKAGGRKAGGRKAGGRKAYMPNFSVGITCFENLKV